MSTTWLNGTTGWTPTDFDDTPNGHGTHVTGTVAGDPCAEASEEAKRQPGKGARVIFFDVQAGEGEFLSIPPLLTPVWEAAYVGGARVFTNSWGGSENYYSTYAWEVDHFAARHGDAVVLFANGNDGPERGTVGSPATALNVISVGATFNTNGRWRSQVDELYRNRKAVFLREQAVQFPHRFSETHLAAFSSRGPNFDGRRKPTLVAPGAFLLSARAHGNSQSDLLLMQGTSMATPLVARAVLAVR